MRSLSLVEQVQLLWNFFWQLPWKWWLLFFLGIGFLLFIFADRFFGRFRNRILIGLVVVYSLLFCFRYRTALLPLADFIGTQFVSFLSFPNLFLYSVVGLWFTIVFLRQVVIEPRKLRYRLWILICYSLFVVCNVGVLFLLVRGDVLYHFPEFYTDVTMVSLLQMSLFVVCLWVVGDFIFRIADWFAVQSVPVKKDPVLVESTVEQPSITMPVTISNEPILVPEAKLTGDLYTDLEPVLKDAHDFFGL